MYKYFVAFNASYGNKVSFGHTETTTDTKIKDIEEIRRVAASIEEHFNYPKGSVAVLNFKAFDEEVPESINVTIRKNEEDKWPVTVNGIVALRFATKKLAVDYGDFLKELNDDNEVIVTIEEEDNVSRKV